MTCLRIIACRSQLTPEASYLNSEFSYLQTDLFQFLKCFSDDRIQSSLPETHRSSSSPHSRASHKGELTTKCHIPGVKSISFMLPSIQPKTTMGLEQLNNVPCYCQLRFLFFVFFFSLPDAFASWPCTHTGTVWTGASHPTVSLFHLISLHLA